MEISEIANVKRSRGRSSNTVNVTKTDGTSLSVPEDPGNRHYRVITEWVAQGNEILPPDPKPKDPERGPLAYCAHPLCVLPSDQTRMWRYMSLTQFVNLLQTKALWFPRGHILAKHDRFEGQLPKPNLSISPDELHHRVYGVDVPPNFDWTQGHRDIQHQFRVNTLINCWTASDHESFAMWNVFGKTGDSIAIQTTLGGLKQSFGDYTDYNVYIGEIRYLDYEVEELDERNYLNLFLHKTKFYEYENEIRLLIYDDGDISIVDPKEPYFWLPGDEKTLEEIKPGELVPVDLSLIMEKVYVSPLASSALLSVTKGLLEHYGVPNVDVCLSGVEVG